MSDKSERKARNDKKNRTRIEYSGTERTRSSVVTESRLGARSKSSAAIRRGCATGFEEKSPRLSSTRSTSSPARATTTRDRKLELSVVSRLEIAEVAATAGRGRVASDKSFESSPLLSTPLRRGIAVGARRSVRRREITSAFHWPRVRARCEKGNDNFSPLATPAR